MRRLQQPTKTHSYFSEKIRNFGFRLVDSLSGESVFKNEKEIDYLFHHKEEVESYQEKKFQALANWAADNVEFYSSVKKHEEYKLQDFPIIDKNIIKENHATLCSDLAKRKDCFHMFVLQI